MLVTLLKSDPVNAGPRVLLHVVLRARISKDNTVHQLATHRVFVEEGYEPIYASGNYFDVNPDSYKQAIADYEQRAKLLETY